MGVLIFFIHHIAVSIQLPRVIHTIAGDLSRAIDAESTSVGATQEAGPSVEELLRRMDERGGTVGAPSSGYLQFIRHQTLVGIATEKGAVIRLLHRPGHFVVRGQAMATVWPREAAPAVTQALRRAHISGANRTLAQDLPFAVDQLVEIAIRALSSAVNDTFTALTCIDWLGESLAKISNRWHPVRVHRDGHGFVRVITAHISYDRLVEHAFEKIRQAGRGMPAVLIRQLESLTTIVDHTQTSQQREQLLAQAHMIYTASEESVPEPNDRADVRRAYDEVLEAAARAAGEVVPAPAAGPPGSHGQ
ncbi:MAG: DUF2254 domain-containing protein [Solirubrobacterales bacterium]|nr:DUF2254 domain-containing protein [Solirubrobacterales bacterium]